ncbi:restriction endonuclease subunit S [Veillonella parvula]|uniref:restriction endonuclease subunit S n=1 Tax=Veillonella parvula TaxID=29466 RepID=UPI001D063F91|nr:restriction endonuclease subunit S [Veillonella parvula]MCB6805685.1 restriction endonuclease subunit S [Veillonella parvula]MCQ4958114.1 restriction endonuclease subunit S [Veillonella parvula]
MAEWIECKISDIGTVVGGATPSTKKPENYENGTIAWITPKDLSTFSGRYIQHGERNITEAGLRSCSTQLLPKNTVLFSSRAPIGYVAIAANDVCTNQGFKSVISNENTNPLFLYYLLKYNKDKIEGMGSGTTFKEVSGNTMKNIVVSVPTDKKVQERISSMLGSIDDKIEENERINNNLEQQADALYQEFFSPKSGTQGKIATLDEYCSIFTGKKNANASVDGGQYKFFTCAPDALQIDSYIYDGNAIIVSGNGAYAGRTRFYSGRFDLYQRTYACTLLDNINPDYIFPLYWFVKLELSKKIMGGTRGSAIPYIVMNDLAKFEFIYNNETFAQYMPIFKTLTETIQANEFENETLANTRDSLLPQLMSGELDVSDIDL